MVNITRFSPTGNALDDLFRGFFMQPVRFEGQPEVKNEKEVMEGEELLRSERYYGSVSRVFSLAQDVDEGAAQAKYTDGVLELTLPKKKAASTRKLVIQ